MKVLKLNTPYKICVIPRVALIFSDVFNFTARNEATVFEINYTLVYKSTPINADSMLIKADSTLIKADNTTEKADNDSSKLAYFSKINDRFQIIIPQNTEFKAGNKYEIFIKKGEIIVYRGKMIVTKENTDIQNYTPSKQQNQRFL